MTEKRKETQGVPVEIPALLKEVKNALDVNYRLCKGCRRCEIVCSLKKNGMINPALSRVRIYQFYPGPIDVPILCRQCSTRPCLAACPPRVKAMFVDENTGATKVDPSKCLGVKCGQCAKACTHGAILFHPTIKEALVCDLCDGDPECVKACPAGVFSFLPGVSIAGIHYAFRSAQAIAESLAVQFYPVKTRKQGGKR
jgi:carbon-monoxide dehydrogenase iron sulfur subunit